MIGGCRVRAVVESESESELGEKKKWELVLRREGCRLGWVLIPVSRRAATPRRSTSPLFIVKELDVALVYLSTGVCVSMGCWLLVCAPRAPCVLATGLDLMASKGCVWIRSAVFSRKDSSRTSVFQHLYFIVS
jgi:hypothetical protein